MDHKMSISPVNFTPPGVQITQGELLVPYSRVPKGIARLQYTLESGLADKRFFQSGTASGVKRLFIRAQQS